SFRKPPRSRLGDCPRSGTPAGDFAQPCGALAMGTVPVFARSAPSPSRWYSSAVHPNGSVGTRWPSVPWTPMLVVHSSRAAAVLRSTAFVVSLVAVALVAAVHAKRAEAYSAPTAWQLKHHRVLKRERSVVRVALKQRGIPYRWGGASRAGFDCSGL